MLVQSIGQPLWVIGDVVPQLLLEEAIRVVAGRDDFSHSAEERWRVVVCCNGIF
jgi:hypothetical protein